MVACVFCNILTSAVQKQSVLNKQRPREDRFTEEMIVETLLKLCKDTAPRLAKNLKGYKKDAEMICRRVVKENANDMVDAAALGEDIKGYCKELELCPMTSEQFQNIVEMASQVMHDEAKDADER